MTKPQILCFADTAHQTAAVQDHIKALSSSPAFDWHFVNPLVYRSIDQADFSAFDAIGIHYSIKPYDNYYLSAALKARIACFPKAKFIFLQDEYKAVNQVQDYLAALDFDLLFTLVSPDLVHKAYPDHRLARLKKVTVLTGYVSQDLENICPKPLQERPIDVSYRARTCDFWLGRLAYEKQAIAHQFVEKMGGYGLRLDISTKESDRVYGQAWLDLLQNSKAVLGTESGASVWDFDGAVETAVRAYMKRHKAADFEQVYANVLRSVDGKIPYQAISPRLFEAVATHTPLILFPGQYNDIFLPDKHYVVLEKDFSNRQEVLNLLKDTDRLAAMAERAYVDLIESKKYAASQLGSLVERALMPLIEVRVYAPATQVDQQLQTTFRRYKYQNRLRKIMTELWFIAKQGFRLITDERYDFKQKTDQIRAGLNRYRAYLVPRLKSTKTHQE